MTLDQVHPAQAIFERVYNARGVCVSASLVQPSLVPHRAQEYIERFTEVVGAEVDEAGRGAGAADQRIGVELVNKTHYV